MTHKPLRTRVRHTAPPAPNGCRWCGKEALAHAIEWAESASYHVWAAPTDRQRKARMQARRSASLAA